MGSPLVGPALDWLDWLDPPPGPPPPVVLESLPPVVLEPPPPGGEVLSVGWVESGGCGSVVVGALELVELVGGSVVLVGGGLVVGGTVLLLAGGRRRGLVEDGGAGVAVEVVACLLGGTTTACLRVVDGLVELSGETRWRGGGLVVVVVCAVALATWPGEVTKPTTLPPMAPISIAVTTLTQRRAATNEIGRNPEAPRFEPPGNDDRRQRRGTLEHLEQPDGGGAVRQEELGGALERWREELEAWAIPEEILERAPESPWGFPVGMFRAKTDQVRAREPNPSARQALRHLEPGGTVLDVGAGGGAASLPLAAVAGRITAVDESEGMTRAFLEAAAAAGVKAAALVGRWPDVAAQVEPADVVVCNDVLYNVQDLAPFALALTDHARRRVVAQVTGAHPLATMGPLWRRFHGLDRPSGPTADDAVAALRSLGLEVERSDWTTRSAGSFERYDDLVAFIRRRLCLPAGRDLEIAEALEPLSVQEGGGWRLAPLDRPAVTLSWAGTAA